MADPIPASEFLRQSGVADTEQTRVALGLLALAYRQIRKLDEPPGDAEEVLHRLVRGIKAHAEFPDAR